MDARRRGTGEFLRHVVADVDVGGSSEHAAFSTDGCASMRSCAERSVRSSESRLFSWSPSEGPWSRRPGRSSTLALGSLRSWLTVASGSLCATAGRAAEGDPKSITESRDGTFGSFEELPHQLLMVAIGPLGQEGLPGALWAPSHAPELEALSLPSREAEASVMLMMSGWWSPSSRRRRSTVFLVPVESSNCLWKWTLKSA